MFDLVVVHMLGYHWVGNLTFAAYMVSTTFALSSLIGFYHTYAKELQVPVELVEQVRDAGRLPVVTFAAGGLATPADVGLLMELGCDGVFVGSGIFKGENPAARARAMVAACTHYKDPATVARVSANLGKAMVGLLEHESGPEVAAKLALQGRTGVDPAVAA